MLSASRYDPICDAFGSKLINTWKTQLPDSVGDMYRMSGLDNFIASSPPNDSYTIRMETMIIAVVVTYNPDLATLVRLLDAVKVQVKRTVVVDNGSLVELHRFLADRYDDSVHCVTLGSNYGVARAQNEGIAWARALNADFVVLFDQDSLPKVNMVEALMLAHQKLDRDGVSVAAVGPRYVDERNAARPSFSRLSGMRLIKENCLIPNSSVLSDFVISSGSLISLATLDAVGGMADDLFIDQVDIEWGLRAQSLGFQSFGVCDAVMTHSLGENPLELFGIKILHHSPLRHYYIFRNAIWLVFKRYTALGWKLHFIRMIIFRVLFYPIFVSPRFDYLKMMGLGIWHGVTGRMGKLDVK